MRTTVQKCTTPRCVIWHICKCVWVRVAPAAYTWYLHALKPGSDVGPIVSANCRHIRYDIAHYLWANNWGSSGFKLLCDARAAKNKRKIKLTHTKWRMTTKPNKMAAKQRGSRELSRAKNARKVQWTARVAFNVCVCVHSWVDFCERNARVLCWQKARRAVIVLQHLASFILWPKQSVKWVDVCPERGS